MKIAIPQVQIDQASSQQVQVGEVRLGAVNIGRLTLSQVHMGLTTGTIRLCGVSVSLGLSFGLDWTFSLKIDGLELLPSFIVRKGHINIGALAMNIPLADISLDGLDKLALNLKSTTAKDVKATVGAIKKLKLGNLVAERIQAQGLSAPAGGVQIAGLGLGGIAASGLVLPDASLVGMTIGRVSGGSVPLDTVSIPGVKLPPTGVDKIVISDIEGKPRDSTHSLGPAGAGLLQATLTVTVSAGMSIDELRLANLSAEATIGEIKLDNLTLPYEVMDLSLSQLGIRNIQVPKMEVN